jgi:hypothetical protein
MSSLDHRGTARRRTLKQQQPQQQQQLSSPPLAFRKAQLPSDLDYFFDPEQSRIPTPASSKYGVRPRSSFSKTRTLKDAFEATSRATAMDSNEGHSKPISIGGRTPSPRSRRQRDHSLPSPLAEAHSPPPADLLETYQRINDADDLADLVSEDDLGGYSRRSSKERRKRESSGSRDRQKTQFENGDNDLTPNFSYLNDIASDSQRGNLSTYKRDEERLRQATASQVPIFSRASVGTRADDLQRREAEPDEEKVFETDDGPQPALNVPRSWGNKSKNHRQWLSSIARQNGTLSRDKTPRRGDGFERRTETTIRDASRSRSPRYRLNTKESVPAGDAIPNTPVVVFKGGYTDRPQAMRSDSRDLLRRLARTESPPQTDTPEPKKLVDQPLPDKTPVVIGAWVDTPVTVRPAQTIDEDFTRELDSPSKPGSEIKRDSTKPPTEKDTESNHKPEHKPDANVEKQPSPELVKPKLPKSALESVIEDAKSNGNPLQLGDDTINSLQGLMDGSEGKLSRFGDLDDQDIKEDFDAIELEDSQMDSEKYLQSVDRLSTKIQSIIHSVHDAQAGLDGLADSIAPSIGIHSSHKDGKSCKACGISRHNHGGERVYVAIPIPRLWYRTAVSQRLRLTYVGWALIFLGIWYISECLMCDQFCHPTVAEVCDGYCLQPDAPQFPLTLPTMLWRWSHLATVLSPVLTVSTAVIRLVAQILGLWDGYVDDNSPLSETNLSLGEIAIGNRYGISGISGLWSRSEKDSPVLTSSAAPSISLPTPLQQVVEGYQIYGRAGEGQGADSIDDDETL